VGRRDRFTEVKANRDKGRWAEKDGNEGNGGLGDMKTQRGEIFRRGKRGFHRRYWATSGSYNEDLRKGTDDQREAGSLQRLIKRNKRKDSCFPYVQRSVSEDGEKKEGKKEKHDARGKRNMNEPALSRLKLHRRPVSQKLV